MNAKFKAALRMSALTPEGKVTKAETIVSFIQRNTNYFPTANLPIPLASVSTAITTLHTALLAVGTGTPGALSNMHEKDRIVVSFFNLLRAYVEMVANNTPDPKTVIEAAGMEVQKTGGQTLVSELTLTALGNGIMQVSVPRNVGEVSFIYQYSTDSGTTWLELAYSKLATVSLSGQIPATVLHFRFAPVSKVKGAFSQAKSAIVL